MGDESKTKIPDALKFIFGGVSGMSAMAMVQPADLVKTRMQLEPAGSKLSTFHVVKNIINKEGIRGLYIGISASLFRQATYTTARLGSFNTLVDWWKHTYSIPSFGTKIMLGMMGGGIGAFVGTPAEVALIRMTADGRLPPEQRRNYKHIFNALARITREEGITTLWRGTTATVTRAMVVNGVQLGTYAQAREMLLQSLSDGILLHFCSAMIAGFFTTVASLPVDIVKTRVQYAAKGSSQIKVLLDVIRKQGVLTLWSGFLPTYAKLGPHTVLTFTILEQINAAYLKYASNS